MAKLEKSTTETKTEETEITVDYCFERAARTLDGGGVPPTQNGNGALIVQNGYYVTDGGNAAVAKEWRELGLAIHDVGGSRDSEWARAKADAADIDAGVRTRNEVRASRGLPLIDAPEFNRLEGDDGDDSVGAKV